MIISHRKETVFVHIPKCAGSALRKVLKTIHDDEIQFEGIKRIDGNMYDMMHLTPSQLRLALGKDLSSYFHIFVIRNPLDRWFSSYMEYTKHIRKLGEEPIPPDTLIDMMVDCKRRSCDRIVNDIRFVHFKPQSCYLETPVAEKVILRLDDLAKKMVVRNHRGEEIIRLPLGVFDTSKKKFACSVYDKLMSLKSDKGNEILQKIKKVYKEDFDLWESS